MPKKGNVVTKGLLESLRNSDPKLFDLMRSIDTRLSDIESTEEADILDFISKNVLPRSYDPLLTATVTNPTKGNSTLTGAYIKFGPFVYVEVIYLYGNVGVNPGSGTYSFSLPVQSLSLNTTFSGFTFIAGVTRLANVPILTENTVQVWVEPTAAYVTHNVPGVWAFNNFIKFSGMYIAKR